MKTIFTFFTILFALNSFAATTVDVISAEFGVEDSAHNKTLCLTVVRLPSNGKLLGVVEEIEDCFYARQGKKNFRIAVDLKALKPIKDKVLLENLLSYDTLAKYYLSEVE